MKKLLVMMLLCVGLCFAACGQKEDSKENTKKGEGKSDFVVEINGKEYDLRKDYEVLLNDLKAESVVDDRYSVMEKTDDGEFVFYPVVMSSLPTKDNDPYKLCQITETAYNGMGYIHYRIPAESEEYVYSDTLKSAIDSSYYADKDTYFVISPVGYSRAYARTYVDGELLDISAYREKYKGFDDKKSFRDIFLENEINIDDLGGDWTKDLRDYAMKKYGLTFKNSDKWMDYLTLADAKELISDFNEEFCDSLACYDVGKKLEEGSIKEYERIVIIYTGQEQFLEIGVNTKDAGIIQRINERIETYSGKNVTE